MKKYGVENFKFEVLEILDKYNNLFIEDDLSYLEKIYVAKFHSFVGDPLCNGYNLTSGGERPAKMSLESRQRAIAGMKKYWSIPESREKARQARLGKAGSQWSDERKKRRSESMKGIPLPLSAEVKQKIAENRRIKGQKIIQNYWNLIKDFDRSKYGWTVEASKQTGLPSYTIQSVCKKMGFPVRASYKQPSL